MSIQSTYYNNMKFAQITDYGDFYRSTLPELKKVKSLFETLKIMFNLPTTRILLEVAEGHRVYKFNLMSPSVNKYSIGTLVYLPLDKRLDFYDNPTSATPFIQWVNKKVVFKNYAESLDRLGLDKIFQKLINLL